MTTTNTKNIEEISQLESDSEDEGLFDNYCSNCLLSFSDPASYRNHYKSEIHHYNSKRAIAHLKPVTLEQFEQRKQSTLFYYL